eukprot:g1669.t1
MHHRTNQNQWEEMDPLIRVIFWSSISGLSTGIGGLFVYCAEITPEHNAGMLGFAGGVMVTLSILDMLLPVMLEFGFFVSFTAFAGGVLFTRALSSALTHHEVSWDWLSASSSRKRREWTEAGGAGRKQEQHVLPLLDPSEARNGSSRSGGGIVTQKQRHLSHRRKLLQSALLTTISLALHNAPEGVAVGLTVLSNEEEKGESITATDATPPANHHVILIVLAIILHNIPEGIAVATALFQATKHRYLSFVVATFTGLVEPISAILAVVLLSGAVSSGSDTSSATSSLENIHFISQVSLAAVGGVMVQVSVAELVPQARDASKTHAIAGVVGGVLVVVVGLCFLGTIGLD